MSRLLLIVILFTQLFAPQAATAGTLCEFMPSGQSPKPNAVTHHAAAMHDVSLHDEASPYHCDIAGHCPSTVVGPFMRTPGFALPRS